MPMRAMEGGGRFDQTFEVALFPECIPTTQPMRKGIFSSSTLLK